MSIMFSVLEIVDNVQVLTLACLQVHGSQNSTGIAALYRDTMISFFFVFFCVIQVNT